MSLSDICTHTQRIIGMRDLQGSFLEHCFKNSVPKCNVAMRVMQRINAETAMHSRRGSHTFYCVPVAVQPNAFWTLSRTLLIWAKPCSLNSDLVAWPGCSGAALMMATPNGHGNCTAQHGEYVHGHLHGSKRRCQLRLHVFLNVNLLLLARFCKICNLLWMVPSHEEHGEIKICS